FKAPLSYTAGFHPQSLIVGDLNGDRSPDLATANFGYRYHGDVLVFFNEVKRPFSHDRNRNAVPDECETRFHRGDPNSSGATDIAEAVTIFGSFFMETPTALACMESAAVNTSGAVDISDGISILNCLFLGGPPPVPPGPATDPCGLDPDAPGSPGDIG